MKTTFLSLFLISILSLSTMSHAESASISKQEAVAIATQKYPGRVLAVKHQPGSYQVKILSDSGKVKVIRVDDHSASHDKSKPRR